MNRSDYMRDYMRTRRAKAREAGLCIICTRDAPRSGLVTCDGCQGKTRAVAGR